jgi:filamentous hemagglutinin
MGVEAAQTLPYAALGYAQLSPVSPSRVRLGTVAINPGSGPAAGFLEVSDSYASSKAVQNFSSTTPTDFVFDAASGRFIMGRNALGHDGVIKAGRITPTARTVGGRIYRQNGILTTDERSGHYGQNWTPELRKQYEAFMKEHGVSVTHTPWNE